MGQQAHLDIRKGLGGPSKGPEWVGRLTRRSERVCESHPKVWERSGVPPKDPEGLGGPPEGPEGVRSATRRSERGWETHPKVQ